MLNNTFNHNFAAGPGDAYGHGGVMQVNESDIIVKGSIFSNNTAEGTGGVLHTHYPARCTIVDSSFNNKARGDGGVM